jgi:hypothetical protein
LNNKPQGTASWPGCSVTGDVTTLGAAKSSGHGAQGRERVTLVPDYRWQVLVIARPAVVTAFNDDGVVRVEYVSAFPGQQLFAVWLGTATDAEASQLRTLPTIHARVHDLLLAHGFEERDLDGLMVVVQSQETVDRDYDGSWFYALR